ncbi:MAG TPA: cytochrome c3 family protein, partial [Terriglobales bacterium]
QSYIAQHKSAVSQPVLPIDWRIPRGPEPVIARNAEEWVRLRAAIDEQLLWRKTCAECHTLRPAAKAETTQISFPEVPKANIKPIWLPNSVFSHYSHISVDCKSCHSKATASEKTSDVLIPSIKTCQSCHNGKPEKVGQAENGCFLCHQYHQWQNQEPIKGKYSIPQLTSSVRTAHSSFLASMAVPAESNSVH